EGIRLVLKSLLRQRFGSVPPDSLKRLDSIDDSAVLERIGARILEAESLSELGLEGDPEPSEA
ncbi:MAG: hypothetical protein AAF725_09880, partial [Acidobacteriota bacterium]